jgi:predicted ATPase
MLLHIKNFRAIKEQSIELAPITVVYGANGAGKSSLIYSLLTLRNIVLNPNQKPSGFFNYTFVNLGGYQAVVFDHKAKEKISLGIELKRGDLNLKYEIAFDDSNGSFELVIGTKETQLQRFYLEVGLPYPLNQESKSSLRYHQIDYPVDWNGAIAKVSSPNPSLSEGATRLAETLNSPIELLRTTQVVPLKRGFSKPYFSSVPLSPTLITEDEVATFLAANRYLVSKLSRYLEEIVGHDLRINYQPGTSIFSLDSTNRHTGIATELVNEGFGVNQIVYFLALCLKEDSEFICVEEPEIHLHPTAVRRLARVLVEISEEENKRFLISTHSDAFLFAILTAVAEGKLKSDNLACYFAHKDKRKAQFERQTVNEKGQIAGGLASFIEGELQDIRTLLHIPETLAK